MWVLELVPLEAAAKEPWFCQLNYECLLGCQESVKTCQNCILGRSLVGLVRLPFATHLPMLACRLAGHWIVHGNAISRLSCQLIIRKHLRAGSLIKGYGKVMPMSQVPSQRQA